MLKNIFLNSVLEKIHKNVEVIVCGIKQEEWRDKITEKVKQNHKRYNEQNKEKRNIYLKNKRETDVKFRLIGNTRNRIYNCLKGMTKQSSTIDVLGIDIDTYKKWLDFQFTPEINWDNFEIDHVKAICLFDMSKDEELGEAFIWKSTQPLLKNNHQKKGTKFNFLDHQLQFIETYQFLRLNDQEG